MAFYTSHNPRQNSLKHLCTSLSPCNVEMLLQSCMATTTLQKGGGKQKGAEFSKVFQGFCLRLQYLSVSWCKHIDFWYTSIFHLGLIEDDNKSHDFTNSHFCYVTLCYSIISVRAELDEQPLNLFIIINFYKHTNLLTDLSFTPLTMFIIKILKPLFMKILLQILPYGKTREFRPRTQSQNYITHLPSTNEVKWISDKKDLNTSSFKHLFNALLISLHSPRNFPTGCCKERRKKICIQHKNMAKQARVYSTTR